MEKILTSIKKQIGGIDEEVTSFDDQIVMGINMAIATLTQISDLETSARFIQVQSYIYCRTKLFFDPPASQTMMNALQSLAAELEWRLKVESEKS